MSHVGPKSPNIYELYVGSVKVEVGFRIGANFKKRMFKPYKKFLFTFPARTTFGERIRKNFIFYFIEFDVFCTTINCLLGKADPFFPLL